MSVRLSQLTILNVSLPTADTEVSVTLPLGTGRFKVQARTAADVKMAVQAGQSGTDFWTIKAGEVFIDDDITSGAPLTLYLQSAAPGIEVEVAAWS